MFQSIKNWMDRYDTHSSGIHELEDEARQFSLPSESLPQIFKHLFFIGLALLNYRLFAHAVPGAWGQGTGVLAVMCEAMALYCSHNFSRSAGLFRASLAVSGTLLMAFSLFHGTCSIMDLTGAATINVAWYSRAVAFPMLAIILGISVIAITMCHPHNIVRLRQSEAHTRIAVTRANAASELSLMRSKGLVEHARLDHFRERTRREAEYLQEFQKLAAVEERKHALVAGIADPNLRESLAREIGVETAASLPALSPLETAIKLSPVAGHKEGSNPQIGKLKKPPTVKSYIWRQKGPGFDLKKLIVVAGHNGEKKRQEKYLAHLGAGEYADMRKKYRGKSLNTEVRQWIASHDQS